MTSVRALFLTLGLALPVAGCGKDAEPAPIAAPSPTTTTTEPEAPPPAPTARVVGWRSPFGDTLHPDNLMIDGDFEFTGRSGQMPWILVSSQAQAALDFDTGGRCRSGVRCAKMRQDTTMIGYLASPREKNLFVRVWGKPDSTKCGDVTIVLVDESANQTRGTLAAQQPEGDELGWCRYELLTKSMNQYPYPWGNPALVVQAKKSATLIDDAVALPSADGTKPLIGGPPLTDAQKTEIHSIIEWVKSHRQFGIPPRSGPSY